MVSCHVQTSLEGTIVLAACDKELLGQKFEDGEKSIHVDERFYGGEIVTLEVFTEKLKASHVANLIGERVVNKAIELGLVLEDSVMKIQGTPHAQCFSL